MGLGGRLHLARMVLQLGAGGLGAGHCRGGLFERPGVLDGHGRVRGQGREDGDVLRRVRAVVAVGHEQQADHIVFPQQRHADHRCNALVAEGRIQRRVMHESRVVQVVRRGERQARLHHHTDDAQVTARHHVAGAAGQRTIGGQHVEGVEPGVVGGYPGDLRAQHVARARDDGAQQFLQVEPARQVACRFDHGQHAAFALLRQVQAVAQRHRHAHQFHQRGFRALPFGQRLHLRQARRELFRAGALVQQPDKVPGDRLGGFRRELD